MHLTRDDISFERHFATKQFSPAAFDHAAHIRLAWIHIIKYGLDKATKNVFHQLKEFVVSAGAAEKFHVTLTLAAVQVVNHFITRSASQDFSEFSKEFPQLFFGFKKLLDSHYSHPVLFSETAKKIWVEPDLQSFQNQQLINTC